MANIKSVATPKGFDGRICRIVTSDDGGPIRRIINGRSRVPTGTFTSVKAGGRAMPHQSERGELKAMWVAEAAACVRKLLAQPHRLEISVSARSRPLLYFPDLQLEMDETAALRIADGQRFASALFAAPEAMGGAHTRTVVLEIKTSSDGRVDDPDYRHKLKLAGEIYQGLGIVFVVVQAEEGLMFPSFSDVKRIVMNRNVRVDCRDVEAVGSILSQEPTRLSTLASSIQPGPLGLSKIFALHVRRVVSIDLRRPIDAETLVYPVRPGRSEGARFARVWPTERFGIR